MNRRTVLSLVVAAPFSRLFRRDDKRKSILRGQTPAANIPIYTRYANATLDYGKAIIDWDIASQKFIGLFACTTGTQCTMIGQRSETLTVEVVDEWVGYANSRFAKDVAKAKPARSEA